MMTRVRFGYLGFFNDQIGPTPFHRYFLGGDGLANYSLDSRELVGMRGYANNSLTPGFYNDSGTGGSGGNILTKYTPVGYIIFAQINTLWVYRRRFHF